MKNNLVVALCVVSLTFGSLSICGASENPGPAAVAVDAAIVRPACFAATVVGSALFLVTLPVAATSKSVKQTADALVVKPAQATFSRPLGDFQALEMESQGVDPKPSSGK